MRVDSAKTFGRIYFVKKFWQNVSSSTDYRILMLTVTKKLVLVVSIDFAASMLLCKRSDEQRYICCCICNR